MNFNLAPEQQELQRRVHALAQEQVAPIAAEVDEPNHVSTELMRILADAGLLRYTVPDEFGGT